MSDLVAGLHSGGECFQRSRGDKVQAASNLFPMIGAGSCFNPLRLRRQALANQFRIWDLLSPVCCSNSAFRLACDMENVDVDRAIS